MKIYQVEIRENLARIEDIHAKSEEEALEIAENMYSKEIIVLDSSDLVDGAEFEVLKLESPEEDKTELLNEIESQIGYEDQRKKDIANGDKSTWTPKWNPEYHQGYIDGMKQVLSVIKE